MSSKEKEADDILVPKPSPNCGLGSYPVEEKIKEQATEFADGFASPGSHHPNSLIISGPNGAGKRDFARKLIGELKDRGLNRHEWIRKLGDSMAHDPEGVNDLFKSAREHSPIVLVIDIADMLHNQAQALAVKTELRRTWEDCDDIAVLFIIDDENLWADSINRVFQAADMAIQMEKPTRSRRRRILKQELNSIPTGRDGVSNVSEIDVDNAAIKTEGFSVDEVRNVVHRAVEQVERSINKDLTDDLLLTTAKQLNTERHECLASQAIAEQFEAPTTTWDDIGGLEYAKREIQASIQQQHGWNILLYGPPGTGKTMLARAAANETDRSFIPVKAADFKGEEDHLFEIARRNSPSIIFFDEFDSIAGRRGSGNHMNDDFVNKLLSEIDGLGDDEADIMIIAATNRAEALDPAVCRAGRLHEHIEVSKPNSDEIREIFEIHTDDTPTADDVTGRWFIENVQVNNGAEVEAICERAKTNALMSSESNELLELVVSRADIQTAAEQFWSDRVNPSEVDENGDSTYY